MKEPKLDYEDKEYKNVNRISKLNIKKRIRLLKSIINIYSDISQADNSISFKKDIGKLEELLEELESFPYRNIFNNLDFSDIESLKEHLNILMEHTSEDILIMLLPHLKKKKFLENLKKIKKPYNHPVATKAFPFLLGVDPPFYLKFGYLFKQLGYLIMESFKGKYDLTKSYFLNEDYNSDSNLHSVLQNLPENIILAFKRFEKDISKRYDYKDKNAKNLKNIINKGSYEFNTWSNVNNPSSTNYLRAKNHFRNASTLLKSKKLNESFDKKTLESLIDSINKSTVYSMLIDKVDAKTSSLIKKYLKTSSSLSNKIKKSLEQFLLENDQFSLKDEILNERISFGKLFFEQDITHSLDTIVSVCEFGHEKWIQDYNKMSKLLNKIFPLAENLTYKQYKNLYKKLESFEKLFNNDGYNIAYELTYSHYHPSIKNYFLKFIKILQKKKDVRFNDILSKLHFRLGHGDMVHFGGFFTADNYINLDNDSIKEFHNTQHRLDKKMYHLKKAINFDKNNFEAYYDLANYYENHYASFNFENHDEKRALKTWNNLINCYFRKAAKFPFRKLQKNSINDVGMLEVANFENFIIKRSKEDLFKEYLNTKIIYGLNPDKLSTSKPIAYIRGKGGYNYLFLRNTEEYSPFTKDVLSLSDTIKCINSIKFNGTVLKKIGLSNKEFLKNLKMEYLKNSLTSLINLQEIITSLALEKREYDIKAIVKDKIIGRLDKNNQNLTNALEFLVEKIDDQRKCFSHGDYHSENILIKNAKCVPIDFERINFLPYLYDVVFLLEQKEFSDLDINNKKNLLTYFLNKKGIKFDFGKLKDYDYMSIFINLRYASISSRLLNSSNNKDYEKDIKIYTKKLVI